MQDFTKLSPVVGQAPTPEAATIARSQIVLKERPMSSMTAVAIRLRVIRRRHVHADMNRDLNRALKAG